jgi:hypothetical protein
MATKASQRAAWKANERLIAESIGGKRVPVSGRQRGDQPDIAHNYLGIEVKLRASLPAWMHDAMDQAKKASRSNQTPCVILRHKGQRAKEAFVMFELGAFKKRFMPEVSDE